MCRIAGIISKSKDQAELYKKVSIMCNTMQHGGPDNEGILALENVGLVFGHRRLSIIDLSANGHQPMADAAKKAFITFNGEIYNYLELKTELIKIGARFYTNTDTEVILQCYLYWGTAAFSMLRGMFAFALYDATKNLTYLVRDTNGIKPLYYHIENQQLSFASETKAIKLAGITNESNPAWSIKFLAYGHIPEPDTTLKNVFSLPKGNMLCWDHSTNSFTITQYHSPHLAVSITDIKTAEECIREGLKAAIKRQLIADASIGVFLSGGIDSSLVTLLAGKYKQQQLKTVSLFFDDENYNEHKYQAIIADKILGEKFTHLIKQKDFEKHFPDIIKAMDMPTTDGINTWFISKYAKQDGLKAVLSGIGGDELFGGYPSFKRIKYIGYLRKLGPAVLKTASYFTTDRYKKLSFLTSNHILADYLFLRALFVPADIAKILDCDEQQIYQTLFADADSANTSVYNEEQAAWFESNIYMQNQLLRDTDVMSMSNGLEVRVPFLDEDFQSVVNSIDPGIRFNRDGPKKLLIDAFADILPEPIWNRPKMGFSFPLQQWMQDHPDISDKNFYRGKKAKNIIENFKNNKVHWSKAFALYQIQTSI